MSLENDDAGIDIRLLKERRRTYTGGTPPAGRNPARIRAWSNGSVHTWSSQDDPLYGLPLGVDEAEVSRLLVLRDSEARVAEDAGFTLRVVRPIAPGQYGRSVPLDFSLDVLPGGTNFDNLAFRGDPEQEDLFAAEIDDAVDDDD